MENVDYVAYIDTDSLFIKFEEFLLSHGVNKDKWLLIPDDQKIEIIIKLSRKLEKYINDSCYKELQQELYNSTIKQDDFAIIFKQEIICKTALFVKKKKYGFHVVNDEGVPKDKIDVTGLEIIRSETPKAFKIILKKVLSMILKAASDKEIMSFVNKSKKEIKTNNPSDISSNISINKIDKYIKDDIPMKGTPYHIKGAANYHKLIKLFGLDNKYSKINEGDKASVLYVKPNKYKVDVISYIRWPKEFEKLNIFPDYEKQINKFFIKKIQILLEPMNRESILTQNENFNLFF